ncbi:MAG: ATP-binding cassette domain-containing protein [Lachnospiraceae bacterium]|nr:ATP-binding cassette domain-containing protein [Lachnospiraceae bacterium]
MVQIEINNVTKRIHKNLVLQDVTAVMHEGRIYGLQGVNGSGKTMLMRTIIGLIRPSEGNVSINGKIIGKDIEFPESIGFLLENPAFLGRYSGFDNLNMLAGIRKTATVEQVRDTIRLVGLDPGDKKKYRKYSLGMKQRLGIAAAIMEEPDIVILDEPTNALDESGIYLVKNILLRQKERGALVIISCHDIGILRELSDEIFKLDTGRIIEHICGESDA